jgi:DNA (cytosine-5)-methyltransferase 1
MKSVELFAGAGGLGMGLGRAGFQPLNVIEWDRWCCDTLKENVAAKAVALSGWNITTGDVRDVDFSAYAGKIQLVSGGPPCQPFSMGGKHNAYTDQRDMFPEAIRAVREATPKAFVFENVKGLTRATFRNYFEYIQLQLEHPEICARQGEDWSDHLTRLERHHTSGSRSGLHYRVVTRLLNAADFGVPQKRERVFLVGFRDDLGIEWSFPDASHSQDALIWDQCVSGEYWDRHKVAKKARLISERAHSRARRLTEKPDQRPWLTVRDATCDLPDPERQPLLASAVANHKFQPGARSYPGHTGSPVDEPAKTLKAGVHGVPGGENMLARPDGSVRYFSVRESARLQTFPDDFRFQGAWSEVMRQLGNAVPVRLAETIGREVAKELHAA